MNHRPTYVRLVPSLPYDPTYRMPAVAKAPVYVTISQAWQEDHDHLIQDIGRDGEGACHACGATAWSPMWVAAGFYGDDTLAWIQSMRAIVHSMLDKQAEALLTDLLGAVVLAEVDLDEPAKRARRVVKERA